MFPFPGVSRRETQLAGYPNTEALCARGTVTGRPDVGRIQRGYGRLPQGPVGPSRADRVLW